MLFRSGPRAGFITTFARHRNAANLLMALLLVVGFVSLLRLNTQFFPTFGLEIITINVAWPGASAEDVEANVVRAIEPEVRFLNDVKRVTGFAVEGTGSVIIEFESDADMQKALSEVESAVGRIRTLPEDIERPLITRLEFFDTIARLLPL